MDDMGGTESGGGLFLTAAYFNHSCDPNAFFFVVNGVLYVRSTRDIKKGALNADNVGFELIPGLLTSRRTSLHHLHWWAIYRFV